MGKDYAGIIRNILSREGFDGLGETEADDALETLSGIISDLSFCGWKYNEFTQLFSMEAE